MRHFFPIILLLVGFGARAQGSDDRFTDSLQKRLAGAQTTGERVRLQMQLASVIPDSMQAEVYAGQAIAEAELSRDRWLIAQTYIDNGARYFNNQGLEGNLEKAQRAYETAERVAKENGLSRLLTDSYAGLARAWRTRGDQEKALAYANLALATAVNTDNDTARVRAYIALGDEYREMKNMPLAFQHYTEARSIAEESGDVRLQQSVYIGLMYFYSTMEEYGKAIDYAMRVYAVDRQLWDGYGMVTDLNRVAGFFSSNNQRDLALRMCEHSIALADSLHYNLFKINSYFRIFNMYFQGNEYVKAYRYLTAQPGMSDYLIHVGYSFYPLEIKAAALAEEGLYDSAFYYYQLAAPLVLERGNTEVKTDFFVLFGNYYIRRLRYREAIDCYQKAYALLAAEKDLSDEVTVTDTLQRLYERTGDYRQALVYNRLAGAERDSLRAQTQETELMKLEVETENRRRERAAREEELNTEHRHNIQYMGFTAGLVLLFIAIVLLGRLKVPVSVIRTVVFLSFIFLFEFIILLLDRTIQAWTHEEPWKVLLIKILLASGLVPLHHWLEHRVIHYLSHRRRPATALAQKTH